ncbi:hypothetical protein ONZ45_g4536 [Pleurotus djamor]|nr:hypothetical protein ONZ45_g4536 [Pleurotus djamor]
MDGIGFSEGHAEQSPILVYGRPFADLTRHVTKRDAYPAAHGGFADVWLCDWNPGGNIQPRKVAVKVLRSNNNGVDDQRKLNRRLRRELSVWLSLDHPRVLPLHGVVSGFGPYVSMVCPWMENGNLNAYLSGPGQALSIERRYQILRQVCSGLAYLVHGDLTGCNVLMDALGDACLSDFGLSTIVSDIQGASTLTTSINGNVRFAAPEMYHLDAEDDTLPAATTQSDIYSFGSVTLLVVVKLIKAPLSYQEKMATIQDLRKFGEVQHANVSVYLGISLIERTVAIVMPWVDSRSLCSHLYASIIPLERKLVMIQQVASGLSYLHSLSIIHGGLTGWNVLVDQTGRIQLSNYGFMPFLLQRTHSRTLLSAYSDDFRWADPALWFPSDTPRPNICRASDIFAYGRIMFQILTSEIPFEEEWDDIEAVEACIESLSASNFHPERPLVSAPSVTPSISGISASEGSHPLGPPASLISDHVWALITRCWDDDPTRRPTLEAVAVKVLRSVNSGVDDKRKLDRRLRRELAVWLSLKHPQVLPLYGVVSNFGPYVSMKTDIKLYLRQVCSGLAYLHSRSVVHGDLTGCNVLIDSIGDACLSDFGLSTIVSDMQGASTLTTSISGNVRFAAPEIYRIGADDDVLPLPTAQSDTLTGRIPYHYMRTDGQVLIELARGRRPRRPADSVITEARWIFLCACWANQPSDRPDVESIGEYLSHPDNSFVAKRAPLPPLDRIQLVSLLNVSHKKGLESWTALSNDQTVVAKLVKAPLSDQEKLSTIQGLRKIGEVQHDHISAYLGISVIENTVAIIMPWVDNRNLCSYLRGLFIPIARKLVMIQQVALALSYLHSLSIVHGGLTGWNVLVDHTGSIKLSNYGLMPFIFQRAHPHKLVFTYSDDFRWADPALWFPRDTPRPSISRASDIFAYGRIIFQILTSEPPFQEDWEDMESVEAAIKSMTASDFHPDRPPASMISDNSWELIMRCWDDDPARRPTLEEVGSGLALTTWAFSETP